MDNQALRDRLYRDAQAEEEIQDRLLDLLRYEAGVKAAEFLKEEYRESLKRYGEIMARVKSLPKEA